MSEWTNIETAPLDLLVMTKIDDERGARNEGALYRSGNLWFVPDGSMYVYYRPTHWRHLTHDERMSQQNQIEAWRESKIHQYYRALGRLWNGTP